MILAMSGQFHPDTIATAKTTSKNSAKLIFIVGPRDGAAERRRGIFLVRGHLAAQGQIERTAGDDEKDDDSRATEPSETVTRHRTVKIFFHQIAEHQSQDHRRARIAGAAHEITEDAEGDDYDQI